jgi:hypothetical protein
MTARCPAPRSTTHRSAKSTLRVPRRPVLWGPGGRADRGSSLDTITAYLGPLKCASATSADIATAEPPASAMAIAVGVQSLSLRSSQRDRQPS